MQPSLVQNNQSTFVVVGCFGAGALRGDGAIEGGKVVQQGWVMVAGRWWRGLAGGRYWRNTASAGKLEAEMLEECLKRLKSEEQ